MSKIPVVHQMAVSSDGASVVIELICGNNYEAAVLCDDLVSRLKTDRSLRLNLRCGEQIEEEAPR